MSEPGQPSMLTHLYAILGTTDPFVRGARDARWLMSRSDYDRIRAEAYPDGDDPEDDPEKRIPKDGDCVLGIPIKVVDIIGGPRIVSDLEPAT